MNGELEMVQCFFSPYHVILRSRYPYHYQRCCKQYPNVKYKVCPYNATHLMTPEEFDNHIIKCNSRSTPLTHIVPETDPSIPAAQSDPWEESEVSWATEEPAAYQIAQHDNFIYTPLIGGSKAERVQHRLAERRQFHEFENSKKSSEVQSNNKDKKTKKKKKKSRNSKSNSENVNLAAGNNPIPTNAGNAPLVPRKSTAPERLDFARLSLND